MTRGFADHYSTIAAQYAAARPHYPAELFQWLAQQCLQRELAWDVGTGSGQAAIGLADFFSRVVASDASAAQLQHAVAHPSIDYRCARAEACGLADASVDLVTVAQALHWFDLPAFYAEVKRVLRPAGRIAVWTYGVMAIEDAAINARLQDFYWQRIGPYWPAERAHVHDAYRDLPFPFTLLPTPAFVLRARWGLAQLAGYVRSWSATARYVAQHDTDPVEALEHSLAEVWGPSSGLRDVVWPLAIKLGALSAETPSTSARPR